MKIVYISEPWNQNIASIDTVDEIIYINQSRYNQLSERAQKFVLAHEIAHLEVGDDELAADNLAFQDLNKRGYPAPYHDIINECLSFDDMEDYERYEAAKIFKKTESAPVIVAPIQAKKEQLPVATYIIVAVIFLAILSII